MSLKGFGFKVCLVNYSRNFELLNMFFLFTNLLLSATLKKKKKEVATKRRVVSVFNCVIQKFLIFYEN